MEIRNRPHWKTMSPLEIEHEAGKEITKEIREQMADENVNYDELLKRLKNPGMNCNKKYLYNRISDGRMRIGLYAMIKEALKER